jgi:hypothetical protein
MLSVARPGGALSRDRQFLPGRRWRRIHGAQAGHRPPHRQIRCRSARYVFPGQHTVVARPSQSHPARGLMPAPAFLRMVRWMPCGPSSDRRQIFRICCRLRIPPNLPELADAGKPRRKGSHEPAQLAIPEPKGARAMIDDYDIDARVKREMTAGEIDKLCLKFEAGINQCIEDRRTNRGFHCRSTCDENHAAGTACLAA